MRRAMFLGIRRWFTAKPALPPAARLPSWVTYGMLAHTACAFGPSLMLGFLWHLVLAQPWTISLLRATFPPRAPIIALEISMATIPMWWVAMMLLCACWSGRTWRVRRAHRAACGVLCTACLHPMAGLEQQPRCPECGHPFDLEADAAMWRALQFPTFAQLRAKLTLRW